MNPKLKSKLCIIGYFIILVAVFIGGIFLFRTNDMRDGKLNIELTVEKVKVEDKISDLSEFQTFFDDYLITLNKQCKNNTVNDFYQAGSYKETEDAYKVVVHTRRVDKLGGLGKITYGLSENYFEFDTNNIDTFENNYEGKIRENFSRAFPDGTKANYKNVSLTTPYDINIVDKETNKPVELELAKEMVAKKGAHFISFKLIDFDLVDEISFKVDGKFRFVSSLVNGNDIYENIKVDGNKITITPVECSVRKTHFIGDESTTETINTKIFVGYFAYEQNISPVLISLIITGSILLLTILYFGIFKGYFKKVFCMKTFRRIFKFRYLFILLVPALVLLVIFRYMPMAWLSAGFMEYDLLEGLNSEWVGLKYFKSIFLATNTPEMYRIFRNTIFISVIRIASNIPFILFLAMVINGMKRKRPKTIFQSLSLIPYFLSWVAVGGLFYSLLNSESGLINRLLGLSFDWYHTPDPWWMLLSLSSLWKGMGWSAIIYIAAMCSIDPEQYEAARIDGCGPIRQAFTVTLPGIMGVVCLQLILDTANIMRDNYDQIFAMINGQTIGTIQETVDVVGRISFTSLRDGNFGSATAIGLIQGVIGCGLVILTNSIVKKTDNEGIM